MAKKIEYRWKPGAKIYEYRHLGKLVVSKQVLIQSSNGWVRVQAFQLANNDLRVLFPVGVPAADVVDMLLKKTKT